MHWCLIHAVLLFIGKKHFEEQVAVSASPTKQAAQLGRWADKAVGLGNCICPSFNCHYFCCGCCFPALVCNTCSSIDKHSGLLLQKSFLVQNKSNLLLNIIFWYDHYNSLIKLIDEYTRDLRLIKLGTLGCNLIKL